MFTAFVQDRYGEVFKVYDECMKVIVYSSYDMERLHPDIIEAMDINSDYITIVDSTGQHFYPLGVYSVEIG